MIEENMPKLVLGTMTFGEQVEKNDASLFLKISKERGIGLLDSAHVYNEGATELILGELLKKKEHSGLSIATKVHPRVFGSLNYDSVVKQFELSLERLQLEAVDLLYLHLPDPKTSLERTLEACNDLHARGLFKRLGLSNYSVSQFREINKICERNNWIKPTVYQGLYNAVSRDVEQELLPFLKSHNIEFQAFNPLAGGLLAGKYTNVNEPPSEGRFSLRASYRKRYWSEDYFQAVQKAKELSEESGIPLAEAAIRWLAYHSDLKQLNNSAIILGASKLTQLEQNIKAASSGPLSDKLLSSFEDAYIIAEPNSPKYFQSYKG